MEKVRYDRNFVEKIDDVRQYEADAVAADVETDARVRELQEALVVVLERIIAIHEKYEPKREAIPMPAGPSASEAEDDDEDDWFAHPFPY